MLNQEHDFTEEGETEDLELPLFDFATLTDATGHFSLNNMLGQGGFGSVYKVFPILLMASWLLFLLLCNLQNA